jgi:phospholipase/carboxylesterase
MEESARIGVPQARPAVIAYLDETWRRTALGPADTFLCGFSQGAMMALSVGLSLAQPPLGVVSFSGAFVPPEGFGTAGRRYPPSCLVHGDGDTVVDPALSQRAYEALSAAGVEVFLHLSPGMAHGIAPDGLAFAARFMRDRLESATD